MTLTFNNIGLSGGKVKIGKYIWKDKPAMALCTQCQLSCVYNYFIFTNSQVQTLEKKFLIFHC